MSRSQERQQVSLRAEGSALIAPAARVNPRNRPPAAHRHPSLSPALPPPALLHALSPSTPLTTALYPVQRVSRGEGKGKKKEEKERKKRRTPLDRRTTLFWASSNESTTLSTLFLSLPLLPSVPCATSNEASVLATRARTTRTILAPRSTPGGSHHRGSLRFRAPPFTDAFLPPAAGRPPPPPPPLQLRDATTPPPPPPCAPRRSRSGLLSLCHRPISGQGVQVLLVCYLSNRLPWKRSQFYVHDRAHPSSRGW